MYFKALLILIIVVSISEASLHIFYGTSQLNKAPLIIQEDKQHSVARHDGEGVEENGDHYSAGAVPSSDEQLTTTSTATQHE